MRKFTGEIYTSKVGSSCKFSFEIDDDDEISEEELEELAREAAFQYIDWNFSEDK